MGSFTALAEQLREDARQTLQEPQEATQAHEPVKYGHIDKLEEERGAWAAMTSTMAENIRRSSVKRAELNKAIRAGADPWELLLQATEIIGLMTGDMMTH
ncbi:MAG: hypothetical protein EOM08_07315, partial [Clostridia bacterium]|nr:hypothetical protein [Clostridia bacterium]